MKNLTYFLLGLIFVLSTSMSIITNNSTDFCDGFEEGFCEGFKDVKGDFAVCPPAPVCPVPEIYNDDYRGGYNTGFKKGRRDAK